jgi:uncharacterized membrane protein YdfJ with MMPL/SSD domain
LDNILFIVLVSFISFINIKKVGVDRNVYMMSHFDGNPQGPSLSFSVFC